MPNLICQPKLVRHPPSHRTHLTTRWSAEYPAVAVANSGDVVHLWTVSGEPGGIPLDHWAVPDELQSIWQKQCGKNDGTQPGCLDRTHCPVPHCGAPGPHIMTGPVRVKGAKPGDILKVEILTTEPWSSWGWNTIRKGKGALGEFLFLFLFYSFIFYFRTHGQLD
ncbi:acetamidase/formamidase family protein [Candidatus Dependentiae bacterium]|nr:acetamidase/formamidase family protein [Candidatus Dependentiae bacterium]